jgi:hypothetical protein
MPQVRATFSGDLSDVTANEYASRALVVTIEASDAGFSTSGCEVGTPPDRNLAPTPRPASRPSHIPQTDRRVHRRRSAGLQRSRTSGTDHSQRSNCRRSAEADGRQWADSNGRQHSISLTSPQCRLLYQIVLTEGSADDVQEFLDRATLLRIWDQLWLPAVVHDAWVAWVAWVASHRHVAV